jgi:hypothetical protein
MSDELSEFVGSLTTAITRRADKYIEMLEESRPEAGPRFQEVPLLDTFERFAAEVLDRYVPPGPRTRDSLVFAHMYPADAGSPPEDRLRWLINALLAADVEARGPLRLTQAQNIRLAEVFAHLGKGLTLEGLPLHAARALDRAARLYVEVQDDSAQDRCLLAKARAEHQARAPGLVKVLETVFAALSGYGYRPYRLLGWIALQLLVFTFMLSMFSEKPLVENIYVAVLNYLNPLGFADTKSMSHSAWVLLVVERYTGAVSSTVFFSLVLRRWFRI